MKQKRYLWQVELDGVTAEVIAPDKLLATKAAAEKFGFLWSKVAARMTAFKVCRVQEERGQSFPA